MEVTPGAAVVRSAPRIGGLGLLGCSEVGPDGGPECADSLADGRGPAAAASHGDVDQHRIDDEAVFLVAPGYNQALLGFLLVLDDRALVDGRGPSVVRGEEYDGPVRQAVGDDHLVHDGLVER